MAQNKNAQNKNEQTAQTTQNDQAMQTTQTAPETKATTAKYIVKVKDNPSFCGIGAGGVQFANGQAQISSDRMAAWFREHNGYEVTKA